MRTRAAILAVLACASMAAAQIPQQNLDGTWGVAGSSRSFNNPMSAVIEGHLVRSQQTAKLFQTMLMNEMFNEQWRKIGRQAIAEGKATTALAALDPAMAGRIVGYAGGDKLTPEERDQRARPIADDLALAGEVIRAHGGDPADLASLLAVAMVAGWEQHAGAKAAPGQRAGLTREIARGLLADPILQGQGAIGREMTAGKFAAAIAAVERLRRAGDPAARAAGGAMLQALWSKPLASIEPTPDGFVDRGDRIVAEGRGTAAFAPQQSLEQLAAEAVDKVVVGLPVLAEDAERNAARGQWRQDWVARQQAFARHAAKLGLPENDLAAVAATAVARLWPAAREGGRPIEGAAARQLYDVFKIDIATDPSFQRATDAQRQAIAVAWIERTQQAAANLASAEKIAEFKRQPPGDDAMVNLLRQSQLGVLEADVNLGRSQAASLLTDLFAPRAFDSVTQRPDGTFDVRPLNNGKVP